MDIGLNEVLALVLELAALAILCWWGFATGTGVTAIALGIGAPLVAAVIWGLFAAPKARFSLPRPAVLAVKVLVFGAAAVALAALGHLVPAVVFAVIVVVNLIVEQRRRRSRA
ncbi:YrdB family protein [Kutzneria buriramensis]|uniref:YrdB family protein n=1 Tax=Kutzneria buriramensis TaxID=1045776 RepID=UPI001B865E45|nr:YrdB family protein [Kutzneria buriramensis]